MYRDLELVEEISESESEDEEEGYIGADRTWAEVVRGNSSLDSARSGNVNGNGHANGYGTALAST